MERLRPPQFVAYLSRNAEQCRKKLASRSLLEGWMTQQGDFANLPPSAWN
jgi:hypothetical protein